MILADAFEPLRSALEKAEIRYAVGGSWASTSWGEPRFTKDVDVLADVTPDNLKQLLDNLPDTFYSDAESALRAIAQGKPFNLIHVPTAFKFDIFPARAFIIGITELERAIYLTNAALSKEPLPLVTPEDILLAKLSWYRLGDEVSEVQWRDIEGIVHGRAGLLDLNYLRESAAKIGVADLLDRALRTK